MIRMSWPYEQGQPQVLDEDEFVRRIEHMAESGFADSPPGPIVVEILDDRGRVLWQGHYTSVTRLEDLAAAIHAERRAAGSG
jgi:hypothetical protein